ncbi:hypothetical protein STPYR_12486 [uncultured Stenotrophomonas sp.]|uniref:Uncharacterized protein n=1 Tax=uncultured Stenotrophomonas sp. TaxID=165438 RepID=A0A1Y5Q5K9_9GAMM|nr:hypothetical protein STPYR_12486 [uncultured Stenotrophomonas sp.]
MNAFHGAMSSRSFPHPAPPLLQATELRRRVRHALHSLSSEMDHGLNGDIPFTPARHRRDSAPAALHAFLTNGCMVLIHTPTR